MGFFFFMLIYKVLVFQTETEISKKQNEKFTGLSLELSEREKFCYIFRILGRSFGQILGFPFPYVFYTFRRLPQD